MSITSTIRRLFTREAPRPRVLVAVSAHPNVTLDSQVPKACRIPIYYENNRDASYAESAVIAANPANENYLTAQSRNAAIAFCGRIKDRRPGADVVLYGAPRTMWGTWASALERRFLYQNLTDYTIIAAESRCCLGPSMYFMDASADAFELHANNIEVIDETLREFRAIYPHAEQPRVYPFVSPFFGGRCDVNELRPVPASQTLRLLDVLTRKGWTPILWAHAYTDDAMKKIRGELYQLRGYMR